MATIETRPSKKGCSYIIRFTLNKKRRRINLGKISSMKQVTKFKGYIEKMVDAIELHQSLSSDAKDFRKKLSPKLKKSFQQAGLISVKNSLTCQELWDYYFQEMKRRKLKKITIQTMEVIAKRFTKFFPADGNPNKITIQDAQAYRDWLESGGKNGKPLAEATISSTINKTRQVFRFGKKCKWLKKNVFKNIYTGSQENPERLFEITPEFFARILNYCPNQAWRSFLMLLRVGGLRFAEAVNLKWEQVSLESQKLLVENRKTKRKTKKLYREIPMPSDLYQEMKALHQERHPDEEDCFPEFVVYSETTVNQNLSKKFKQILADADIEVWPRIFQNLRASRSMELFTDTRIPTFYTEEVMGHKETMAKRHYMKFNSKLSALGKSLSVLPQSAPAFVDTSSCNFSNGKEK